MKFEEFGFNPDLLEALSYMGFENATPIQEKAIPEILSGKDLIACAQTGTGKTAAFILPIINKLCENPVDFTSTLVVCPTRELAIQIDQQIQGFAYFAPVASFPVYGGGSGQDWEGQKRALKQHSDIIIATPGKLISHLNMGYVKFDKLKYLILDEADRMLDMGFYDDIQKIISYLPKERQTLFFSATMPPKIRKLAADSLKDPAQISIAISKPAAGVLQATYLCYNNQKIALINSLIRDKPKFKSILIFSSTKREVSEIVRGLSGKGYRVAGVSSDFDQKDREKVVAEFRAKEIRVLVATDVLARGVDIKNINLVINYDVPKSAEDYVHRIGRTARADTTGVAITLINEEDMYKFERIERLIESEIIKLNVPEELGSSPVWNPKPDRRGGGRNYKSKSKNNKGRGNYKGKGKGNRNNNKRK
jgi:superfamily II DNA/RNA helicase